MIDVDQEADGALGQLLHEGRVANAVGEQKRGLAAVVTHDLHDGNQLGMKRRFAAQHRIVAHVGRPRPAREPVDIVDRHHPGSLLTQLAFKTVGTIPVAAGIDYKKHESALISWSRPLPHGPQKLFDASTSKRTPIKVRGGIQGFTSSNVLDHRLPTNRMLPQRGSDHTQRKALPWRAASSIS